MSSNTGKQYGLILPKKKETPVLTKPSVFDSGSDSEEEGGRRKTIIKEPTKSQPKLKTQLGIQKALEEDPTVYEYDSIYDDMKEKKEAKVSAATVEKKPKYIENLLKAADKRKKEYERRVERKIQKEREEEGEKFADKEAFVTSAYKKKMQELQEEEEKEKRMDVIEAMMDVTKQKDLSGFYRHLLNRETTKDESPAVIDKIKEEKLSSSDDERMNNMQPQTSSSSRHSPSSKNVSNKVDNTEKIARETLQRLRRDSETNKNLKSSVNKQTEDADSDFTSDSESSSSDSSDSEDSQTELNKKKHESKSEKSGEVRKRKSLSPPVSKRRKDDSSPDQNNKEGRNKNESESVTELDDGSTENSQKCVEPVLNEEEKLRALFAKRTVGDAFEAAQERYWQRKKLRASGLAVTCA